jgi:hypothetical protein
LHGREKLEAPRHLFIRGLEAIVKISHLLSELKDMVVHDEQTVSELHPVEKSIGVRCISLGHAMRRRIAA